MTETPRWKQIVRNEGRTLAWLADRAGIGRSLMYKVSCGNREANANFRQRVAAVLGQDEEFLFDEPVR